MDADSDARKWTFEEFGSADLGDARRQRRLTSLVRRVVAAPAGRITRVVTTSADRQGAYDLLANDAVLARELDDSRSRGCVERCRAGVTEKGRRVVVIIDQSSIGVPDHRGTKDLGVVGNYRNGGRGLSTLTALAVNESGTSYGILGQSYWARPRTRPARLRTHWRKTEDKETQHVLDLLDRVTHPFVDDPRIRLCVVGDRGYDAGPVLTKLAESGHEFIIRASWNRRLATGGGARAYLR